MKAGTWPNLKPKQVVLALLGFCFGLGLLIWAFFGFSAKGGGGISPDQIKIERGQKTVIVNENGIVEYHVGENIYYDYWDEDRTKNFFAYVRQKAREYLASGKEGDSGYYITLYIDGKEVKIWVSGEDEVVGEAFNEEVSGNSDGGGIADYYQSFFNPTPSAFGLPTPTPKVSGPDVVSAGGGQTPQGSSGPTPAIDCSLYDAQVTGRTIISNALCVPE